MTRPIKFRAFVEGEMAYLDHVYNEWWYNGDGDASVPNDNKFRQHFQNLMQFTGLTDKNGKEIYEGDIVREQREGQGYHPYRGAVISVNGMWVIDDPNGQVGFGGFDHTADKVEVIGNTHENPELMK